MCVALRCCDGLVSGQKVLLYYPSIAERERVLRHGSKPPIEDGDFCNVISLGTSFPTVSAFMSVCRNHDIRFFFRLLQDFCEIASESVMISVGKVTSWNEALLKAKIALLHRANIQHQYLSMSQFRFLAGSIFCSISLSARFTVK